MVCDGRPGGLVCHPVVVRAKLRKARRVSEGLSRSAENGGQHAAGTRTAHMTRAGTAPRIASLDQFRGYTVAGMFLVNFLGHLDFTPQVLKHNNTHFSYADSILPSFLFICGVSYRLSFLRRQAIAGWLPAARQFGRRSLGLILIS